MQGLGQGGLGLAFRQRLALIAFEDVHELRGHARHQSDGPSARGKAPIAAGELLGDLGHLRDGIQQHRGRQRLRQRVREVQAIAPVGLVGDARQLVGPGLDDHPHQVFHVMTVDPEVLGQGLEQFRVGGRIGGAEVVHGIDDALAQEPVPNPIDKGFGEIGVGHDPLGQLHPQIGPLAFRQLPPIQKARLDHLLGPGMNHPILEGGVVHQQGVVHGRVPQIHHPAVKGGHPPELILAPGFKGMVVAAGAVQPPGQVDPHLLGDHFRRGDDEPQLVEEAGGSVVTLGRNPVHRQLVVGLVDGDALSQPLAVELGILAQLGGAAVPAEDLPVPKEEKLLELG